MFLASICSSNIVIDFNIFFHFISFSSDNRALTFTQYIRFIFVHVLRGVVIRLTSRRVLIKCFYDQ